MFLPPGRDLRFCPLAWSPDRPACGRGNEDDSVRADPLTVVNARVEYQLGRVELATHLLNIFKSRDNEIEYFYASRLPGEPVDGAEDRHIRPIKPRQLRVSATASF